MNILKIFIIFGLVFFNFNYAEAKIPYCSKKVTRGCVKPKRGQTAKNYFAPKYNDQKSWSKAKPKKIAKNTAGKKVKKQKRGTASVLQIKLNKKKKKTAR